MKKQKSLILLFCFIFSYVTDIASASTTNKLRGLKFPGADPKTTAIVSNFIPLTDLKESNTLSKLYRSEFKEGVALAIVGQNIILLVPGKNYFTPLKNQLSKLKPLNITHADLSIVFTHKQAASLRVPISQRKEIIKNIFFQSKDLKNMVSKFFKIEKIGIPYSTALPTSLDDQSIFIAQHPSKAQIKKIIGEKYAGKRIILLRSSNEEDPMLSSIQDFEKKITPLLKEIAKGL